MEQHQALLAPLPHVPLSESGALDPMQLPVVLSAPFYVPFRQYEWGVEASTVLEAASHHYRQLFTSWRVPVESTRPFGQTGNPPTVHDLMEALYVLREQRLSPATLETHAQLQSWLNMIKMDATENQSWHELHENFPLMTLNVVRQMIQLNHVNGGSSIRSAIIAGAVTAPASEIKSLSVPIDISAKATEQVKRLDELESKTAQTEKKSATKKHVVLSTVTSLLLSVASFIVLYKVKADE